MRSKSRECAFKIIYADLINPNAGSSTRRSVYKSFGLNEEECAYADKLLAEVEEHREELVAVLDKYSIGFSEKRLFPVDKSLLLMALAEMRSEEDVPDIVCIDEAVGLARKYSTEKSAGFVNGILAAYLAGETK